MRPGAHAGLSGIHQPRQRGVLPAARLRGAGGHTCWPFAAYSPDAAPRTLTVFNPRGLWSMALVVAPVANERSGWVSAKPEPREKSRVERGKQSSVGIFA